MTTDPCRFSAEEVQRLLCEILDSGTTPERAEHIRAQLNACPQCVERLVSERELRLIMKRCCGSRPAPVHVRERITTQLKIFRRG